MKKLFPIVFGLLIWLTGLSSAQACYYTPYGFCLPIMQNLFYPKFQTRLQDPHSVMPRYQLPDQVIRWTVPGYSERENIGQPAITDEDPVVGYSLGYSLGDKYGNYGALSLKLDYVIEEKETNEQRAGRLFAAWLVTMDWPKDKKAWLEDYLDFLDWEGPPEGVTEAQLNGMTPQELLDLSWNDDLYQEENGPIGGTGLRGQIPLLRLKFSSSFAGQYTSSSGAGKQSVARQDALSATRTTKGGTRAMREDAWKKATDTSSYNFGN